MESPVAILRGLICCRHFECPARLIYCSLVIGGAVTIGTAAAQALGINGMTNVVIRKVTMQVCLFVCLSLSYLSGVSFKGLACPLENFVLTVGQ